MPEEMDESARVVLEGIEDVKTPDDANALLAKLMHANLVDYQNTTGALIESYQRQISDLEATISAIRLGVADLFADRFMPTESMIKQAVFYPSKVLVDECRKNQRGPVQ
jgi:hypothetical protein